MHGVLSQMLPSKLSAFELSLRHTGMHSRTELACVDDICIYALLFVQQDLEVFVER